ncbi:hypothetical protein Bca101_061087 [Brassica carinata]
MVLCSCLSMILKRKVMQLKPKQNGTPNQRSRCNQALSSANPARVSPYPETPLPPWNRIKEFTYQEIATATNDFSPEFLIGQGGVGPVYKGRLERIGQIVTIKKLDPCGRQRESECLVEIIMLAVLCHENIVKLVGYCAEGSHLMVVYAYMPPRSLEDHIHYITSEKETLDWSTRMQIALGAAKGLEYLHNVTKPPVIHSNLTTGHILLDHDFKPKITGFGLAKSGPIVDIGTSVVGTNGYWAPEYVNSGKLTLKSDIYSLELSCWSLSLDTFPLFKDDNMRKILDPKLIIESRGMEEAVRKAIVLAFKCLREEPNARPTISEVVYVLDDLVKFMAKIDKKKSIQNG